MKRIFNITVIAALSSMLFLSGCSEYLHQPVSTQEAQLGPVTPQNRILKSLPQPKDQIVCAVYNFRDQTGQYEPSETGASWSTAVTQGATSILIKALEESNWFVVIERENLSNLLNERKIIRSSRQQYGGNSNNQQLLPPLLFAGIILEGGIISYESNIRTGGAGLRYFGAGASGEYREDRVSIYLRAVSSSNGKILKTVYTTKSILSQKVNASLFRYVKLKRLLEAETGFTYNEPSQMAVKEAIEKAVVSLVIEGIQDNLWNTAVEADSTHQVITDYTREENMNAKSTTFGIPKYPEQRGKFSFGVQGGTMVYEGDFKNGDFRGLGSANMDFRLDDNWYLNLQTSLGEYSAEHRFNRRMISGEFGINYKLLPYEKFTPDFGLGLGIFALDGWEDPNKEFIKPKANANAGVEYMISDVVGIRASGGFNYLITDDADGLKTGKYYDAFWSLKMGLNFYLSGNKKTIDHENNK